MRRSSRRNSSLVTFAVLFVFSVLAPRARAQKASKAPADADLRAALFPLPALPEIPAGGTDFLPELRPKRPEMPPAERRAWYLLGLAQHGAAFFDARTTRSAVRQYHELDPLLRPFAHSAAIYPVMQIAPFGLDWVATRLATSRHRWLRRLWWVPQAAATAGFIWSGAHNLGLPSTPGSPPR